MLKSETAAVRHHGDWWEQKAKTIQFRQLSWALKGGGKEELGNLEIPDVDGNCGRSNSLWLRI